MVKLFFVAAVLVVALVQIQGSEDVEEAWERFQAHFPMNIKTPEEAAKRKANFAKAHEFIENHNKESSFKVDHNKFSVLDNEEKKKFLGAQTPSVPNGARSLSDCGGSHVNLRQLPTAVDYRKHKCMQPVKNQGGCGSCWAFAATAVTEFGKCIKTGKKVALSEQQMVDCSTENGGCNGGWYDEAWKYVASAGFQSTSASYPYTANDDTCTANTTITGAVVSAANPVTYISRGDSCSLKLLLSQKRLVSVAIAVVNSFFQYSAGVYTEPDCTTDIVGYHAITVVGYGTLEDVDYWIIRNSWGPGWGAAGYILFQRGVNLCGVENWASSAVVIS